MILYNTSFHIDSTIESDFLSWLKSAVIEQSLANGFHSPVLSRLLTAVEPGCSSFALHFQADDQSVVERWESEGRRKIMEDMFNRWGERALAFSTPMEILDL